ncbi:MAG: hypothetical protein AB7Q81_05010 [Gammaproteobacteria bacterium]
MALIWSEPLSKVAPRLGISDVGLAKICRRHLIQRPPQGHWARKPEDRAPQPTSLPNCPRPELETITLPDLDRKAAEAVEPSDLPPDIRDAIALEAKPTAKIRVPERITRYHPLLESTRSAFKKPFTDQFGRQFSRASGVFEINVSNPQLQRAVRIADTMVKALESRGWTISLDPKSGCQATRLGQTMTLSLFEPSKRFRHEPTPQERAQEARTGHGWYPKFDYRPTGLLTLAADRDRYARGATLAETPTRPLELRLNEFVVRLTRLAWRNHCDALERAEQQRLLALKQAERHKQWLRAQAKRKAIESLKLEAKLHGEAEGIRAYVAAVRRRSDSADLQAWATWALNVAERLDPATQGHITLGAIDTAMKRRGDNEAYD